MKKWALAVAAISIGGGATFTAIRRLGAQPDGSFLVSSEQRIELLGKTVRLEGQRPKDLSLNPDGKRVAILTHRRLIICDLDGTTIAEAKLAAGPLGIAWSPDGKRVYATLDTGKIASFEFDGAKLDRNPDLLVEPAATKGEPGTCGIAVAPDGTIYAALSIRNAVVALGPDGTIKSRIAVGACPYHVALSTDGRTLAVANRGGAIVSPPSEQGDPESRGSFSGTGVANADTAGTRVQVDPRTDAALTGSVTLIRIPDNSTRVVAVGRQPSGMTFSKDGSTLYVADSDEDAISVVDVVAGRETKKLSVTSPEDPGFGQIPTDVALSPDGAALYVSLGGANAIASISLGSNPRVLGYFPTAWYPIALRRSDDKFLIGCAKGVGSRPKSKTTGFGVHDNVGVFQSIAIADVRDLKAMTGRVARNNGWTNTPGPRKGRAPQPVPDRVGEPSLIEHIVYIIKENQSYDVALGDMAEGAGDPSLCTFPEEVTPNLHALARQYGLLDNFYISGTNSADGHQWVVSSVANAYSEQNYAANVRSYPYDGGDPLAFSPAGFLWSKAKAAGKSVRVFGEFVDQPSVIDTKTGKSTDWRRAWADYKSGKGEVEIKPITSQAALRPFLNPRYIGFPSTVSDQYRADVFLQELKDWEAANKAPDLSIVLLPNDHTVGTRPNWPTPRAFVADNDLALGRIVEGISHSKFWGKTLIIVAEDDSQLGLDHIDGHRSIALVISPYSRGGVTNSDLYSHVSIASTIGHVLGIPPMTRFDRTTRPMVGCFADRPVAQPFKVVPNRVPLDELTPPAKKLSGEARRLAEACDRMDWTHADTQDADIVNRAVWLAEAPRTVAKRGYPTHPRTAKPRAADTD